MNAVAGVLPTGSEVARRDGAAAEQAGAVDESIMSASEKLGLFRRASVCFGRSALMLSGAGALGPFHVGVTKALLEQGLLPNVISGSSAGSFVAAVIGTHDEAALLSAMQPDNLADAFGEFSDSNAALLAGRRQIGLRELQSAVDAQIPDMTFAEAFEHTGRKINVSVSPSEVHQSSRLLNAVTSPNVCIREAVMASCAIPGVSADINIIPKRRLWDPSKLLSVLSADERRRLIAEGEAAAWPKLEMIRNCTLIGRTLDRVLDRLEREYTVR